MPLELAEFDLTEERLEFRDTLRRFFEEHAPITEVRRVMESARSGFDRDLWTLASEEMGLAGIAISEAHGGQGFGLRELGIALGEVGRSLAPIPLLASAGLAARVVQAVATDADSSGEEAGGWLEPIAAGHATCLAFVERGGDWDPAATRMVAERAGDDLHLSGEKCFVLGAVEAERIFVVAREPGTHCDEGLGLFAVEAGGEGVEVLPRESFDLTRPLSSIRFDTTPARRVGTVGQAARGIRHGLDEATALLVAEMVGGAQKVLETAVDYAAERHQFSRPIGSFQAIKHKCADLLIDFEGSRTTCAAALAAFDEDEGDRERAVLASVAKSHVGPCYLRMATESGQIQGGVGYTWEYDAHLFYRRALASNAILGDETVHQQRLASLVSRGLEGEAA